MVVPYIIALPPWRWRSGLNWPDEGYTFEVIYERLAIPLTYGVVNALRRAEGVNVFDRYTNFNRLRANKEFNASNLEARRNSKAFELEVRKLGEKLKTGKWTRPEPIK